MANTPSNGQQGSPGGILGALESAAQALPGIGPFVQQQEFSQEAKAVGVDVPSPSDAVKAAGTVAGNNPFGLDFSAVTDFLSYVGWILHPLNWLRMVEFITGIIIGMTGIYLLVQRGGGRGVTASRIIRMTPQGRMIMGRRRGRREAQTQRAVNEGRQEWKNANP